MFQMAAEQIMKNVFPVSEHCDDSKHPTEDCDSMKYAIKPLL